MRALVIFLIGCGRIGDRVTDGDRGIRCIDAKELGESKSAKAVGRALDQKFRGAGPNDLVRSRVESAHAFPFTFRAKPEAGAVETGMYRRRP